ncbi:pilus assembly protein [Rhodoblastus sphagnicola]|uniref:Pilus assembly protein n=1 Tax=Rhodoblastus sphagnicola TaxID=333368 RepID=A0A2S6N5K3_9HYPH|nr:type II secretion system F family protein [Rhodoblastus sphagnicola]MBB4197274.1 tight adherence protein B [Rhodoblastus sphagnicola]PPQ29878.1 pilus assembly protein [Rhodoblastus sphagnicola]
MDFRSLLIVLLALAAASGAAFLIFPFLNGDVRGEKRQEQLLNRAPVSRGERQVDSVARRKQVADSLKELEQRNVKKKRRSLEVRIAQAGLSMSKQGYLIASGIAGGITALMIFVLSGNPIFGGAGLVIGALGLPSMWLSFMTKRRLKKFTLEFPSAVDVIIRGVRAGLPLGDCLRIIASEAAEPVRGEFRQIVEAQTLGMSVAEAVERMPERIPTAEANFFAIVITIQQKAGGNLGEALSNLSKVLRERKKMADKVRAMSSEARASAYIIASLPIAVALLVYITSPAYIEQLWLKETGRVVLFACFCSMAFGSFVMNKMISFDI